MALEPLTLDDCHLLKRYDPDGGAEVVQIYEDCRGALEAIQQHASYMLQNSDLEGLLSKAREKLTQPRYQVGLLGFFQSGKSTTLNRLLGFGIDDLQAPAKEGGKGRATTAVPTRVTHRPPGQPDDSRLEYLRKKEVDSLLRELRNMISDLPFSEEPDSIKLVSSIRKEPKFQSMGNTHHQPLRHLFWLLKSLDAGGRNRLSPDDGPRKQERIKYEDRNTIVNHPGEKPDPANVIDETTKKIYLLESVCLTSERCPEDLEIIDLPGLGSVNVKDNLCTESFVQVKDSRVDGALIFCDPFHLDDASVTSFAQKLKEAWGNLTGRAWMCFCQMDRVEPDSLVRIGKDPSLLENMRKFLTDYGFPPNQAVFITNFPDQLKEEARNPEAGLAQLDGKPFNDAWSDLYPNGGIKHLKKVVFEQMPQQVAKGIVRQWTKTLTGLAKNLASDGRVALGQVKEPRALQLGNIALNRLTSGITALQESRELKGRDELRGELEEGLNDLGLDPSALNRHGDLGKYFPMHAKFLQSRMQKHIREMLSDAFSQQCDLIEQAEAGGALDGLPNAKEGLVVAWEDFRTRDRDRYVHIIDDNLFPSFVVNGLFDGLQAHEAPFTGEEYIGVLKEKIGLVSRQAVQALQERMIDHLWRLVDDLRMFLEIDLSQQTAVQDEEFKRQIETFSLKYGQNENGAGK